MIGRLNQHAVIHCKILSSVSPSHQKIEYQDDVTNSYVYTDENGEALILLPLHPLRDRVILVSYENSSEMIVLPALSYYNDYNHHYQLMFYVELDGLPLWKDEGMISQDFELMDEIGVLDSNKNRVWHNIILVIVLLSMLNYNKFWKRCLISILSFACRKWNECCQRFDYTFNHKLQKSINSTNDDIIEYPIVSEQPVEFQERSLDLSDGGANTIDCTQKEIDVLLSKNLLQPNLANSKIYCELKTLDPKAEQEKMEKIGFSGEKYSSGGKINDEMPCINLLHETCPVQSVQPTSDLRPIYDTSMTFSVLGKRQIESVVETKSDNGKTKMVQKHPRHDVTPNNDKRQIVAYQSQISTVSSKNASLSKKSQVAADFRRSYSRFVRVDLGEGKYLSSKDDFHEMMMGLVRCEKEIRASFKLETDDNSDFIVCHPFISAVVAANKRWPVEEGSIVEN